MQRYGAVRRWLGVAAVVAVVVTIPAVVSGRPGGGDDAPAGALLARALSSAGVGYSGYAESTGGLGLPSIGLLTDAAALLGGTSRLRVWWAGPTHYRVDRLSATGERDAYREGGVLTLWDSARWRVTTTSPGTGPHVPTPADLTPPELGRRLLSPARPGELTAGGRERVAGRQAQRLDVRPADPRALAAKVSVWVDAASGLPLRVAVVPRRGTGPVLTSGFLQVRVGAPAGDAAALRFAAPPDAAHEFGSPPSLTDLADRYPPQALPGSLGDLPRRDDLDPADPDGRSGVATYGRGYVLVALMPMANDDARILVDRFASPLHPLAHRAYGDEIALGTPLLSALLVAANGPVADRGFALVGTVSTAELRGIARELTGAAGVAA